MRHLNIITALFITLTLMSCGSKTTTTDKQGMDQPTAEQYESAGKMAQQLQAIIPELQSAIDDGMVLSAEQFLEIYNANQKLVFEFDPSTQDSADNARCYALQQQIRQIHDDIDAIAQAQVPKIFVPVYKKEQQLLSSTQNYPIYLERGDKMMYDIQMERQAEVRIYNADTHQLLKTYSAKSRVRDSLNITYRAIYLVQVTPKGQQYADIKIGYRTQDINRLSNIKTVAVDSVEAKKGDFLAKAVPGIKMTNIFDEPRKFTLRGQLKAAFSGSYRAIVAIPIPAGTTDLLYSLRISTNETAKYSDGEFYDDMETGYRRIKLLGLPVYESHRGSGLIATLLGENVPPREEDAYINMYVFYNAAQAKKFQDGADPAKLSYNIDYSTLGTQSCNGRIPAKGNKTIYLGFLNERMRYNNYVWLEAISSKTTNEYVKPVFTTN